METKQQIEIVETFTTYKVNTKYYSELKKKEYTATITARVTSDGRITFVPKDEHWTNMFCFVESDPDLALAVVNMMRAVAEMVKKENRESVDTSTSI